MDRFGALELYDTLSRLASAGDSEGYWAAMDDARRASEFRLPSERGGDGFSGAIDGEVLRAPWRGEYDMPGNFERGQRTGNSLANDALLREGLAHQYQYDPEYGVEAYYQPGGPTRGPQNNDAFTKRIHWSGPPDTAKMWLHPTDPSQWDPNWSYVGPDGPPTRNTFFAGRGGEGRQQKRFRDWVWGEMAGR